MGERDHDEIVIDPEVEILEAGQISRAIESAYRRGCSQAVAMTIEAIMTWKQQPMRFLDELDVKLRQMRYDGKNHPAYMDEAIAFVQRKLRHV